MPDVDKKPKGKSDTQSVLFDISKWTISDAKKWLREHDYTGLKVDETEGNYRFRQINPDKFKRMRTINAGDGIKLIVGFKDKVKMKKEIDIDFENIIEFMDEKDFEDNVKQHVLDMINSFSLSDLSNMVQVFDKLIWDTRNVKLIKTDIDEFELNLDNISAFMEVEGLAVETQNLVNDLLTNFKLSELLKIVSILDHIRWQVDDKIRQEEKIEKENTNKLKSFIKSKDNVKGTVKLIKETADKEKRLIYGVVIEPENVDTDNQWTDEENIEFACHTFMKSFQEFGINHDEVIFDGLQLVENYIAPTNFMMNKSLIKKGSWVMVHYVKSDDIWNDIQNGELTGYSFEGIGLLTDEKPL
jgi:hypothetical protein